MKSALDHIIWKVALYKFYSYTYKLSILILPASMTSTENKAKTENVVKPAGEETCKCDDDTLKGEDLCFSLTRSRF